MHTLEAQTSKDYDIQCFRFKMNYIYIYIKEEIQNEVNNLIPNNKWSF